MESLHRKVDMLKIGFTSLLFGLTSFTAMAQMSVRNDNVVIVKDEILFVDDALTLGETQSKLYLREEGQLIQGNEVSTNAGLGELSVYQSGYASNYTFNYWCLPVGNNSAMSGNEDGRINLIDEATNVITAQDPLGFTSSIDAQFTDAYDGFSAPQLTISRKWFYTYSTSSTFDAWNYFDETEPLKTGLGFTMKGVTGNLNQLYDFRGKANNGTISNFVTANEFTLIGNPYPSAIDALLFIHDPQNTNINNGPSPLPTTTGALYYWEQLDQSSHNLSDYIGGYASYTISSTGVESFVPATFNTYDNFGNASPLPPNPGGGGNTGFKIAKRYIPIGQGFMVEGASDTPLGSSVYIKNAHRVYEKISDGDSAFFRMTAFEDEGLNPDENLYNEYGLNIVPSDHKRFRLNVVFNDEYTRQLMYNFHDSASPGFDYGFEAKMPSTAETNAFWMLGNEKYAIQADAYQIDMAIPVAITTENQQEVRFSIFDVQNFGETQPIYIHDKLTDIYVDLTQQEYDLNIDAGNFQSRFEIVFETNSTLAAAERLKEEIDIFVNRNAKQFVISNPNLNDIMTFKVYDTSGKLVIEHSVSDLENRYTYPSEKLSDGVYLTEIRLRDNSIYSKKVILKQ
ncbi:MAG: T9SS type A sorting domain-containing protein [Bacteroidota bacterium]